MGRGGEDSLSADAPWQRRFWLLTRLTDINVVRETPEKTRLSNPEVLYNVDMEDITHEGIKIVYRGGEKRIIRYDTLILSRRFRERRKNDSLFDELQGKVAEVHKIGDCLRIRGIKEVIWSANEIARKI